MCQNHCKKNCVWELNPPNMVITFRQNLQKSFWKQCLRAQPPKNGDHFPAKISKNHCKKQCLRAQPPENGDHFPAKCTKIMVEKSVWKPHRILLRIYPIYRIQRKRNIRCGTDPGFPTPGARITVVYTNSLKLGHHVAQAHFPARFLSLPFRFDMVCPFLTFLPHELCSIYAKPTAKSYFWWSQRRLGGGRA